jgi:hypothetical protein
MIREGIEWSERNKRVLGVIPEEKEKDFSFMIYDLGDLREIRSGGIRDEFVMNLRWIQKRLRGSFLRICALQPQDKTQTQQPTQERDILLQPILHDASIY